MSEAAEKMAPEAGETLTVKTGKRGRPRRIVAGEVLAQVKMCLVLLGGTAGSKALCEKTGLEPQQLRYALRQLKNDGEIYVPKAKNGSAFTKKGTKYSLTEYHVPATSETPLSEDNAEEAEAAQN